MKTIDRKLLRDVGHLRGQVVTICLVVASGIAVYIAMQTAYLSLQFSKDTYYEAYRFPDLFAAARRVPNSVAEQIREIPGVSLVYTRTVESVRIPIEGADAVFSGHIISLPDNDRPGLNDIFIRKGRMPDPDRSDEALLLESFAGKQQVEVGDHLPVIINGTRREVRITGLAMSPEYVFAIGGDMSSYEAGAFAVIWMPESAVNSAFNLVGAFNNVNLSLQPGVSKESVIATLDRILGPYGGFGALGKEKQISNHFLSSELDGLKMQAVVIPMIFLAVAAFLVNVVLNRLVQLQRGQIATLKAIGYSNLRVGMHFLKLAALIVLLGAVIGIGVGAWMEDGLLKMYEPYFSFPEFKNRFDGGVIAVAVAISLFSAVGGAFFSVRNIVLMSPAEAMRPPSPPVYKTGVWDAVTRHATGPVGQMVVRDISRNPVRLLLSALGISMAVAILVIGRFAFDSMEYLMDLQYGRAMRENLTVNFTNPQPANVAHTLATMPGVQRVEGMRTVPIRITAGPVKKDTVIQSWRENSQLRRLINREGNEVELPLGGILLTDVLAERLGVRDGDRIDVEILEGKRPHKTLVVSGTVSDMLGMQGYMRYDTLQRFLGESPLINTALLGLQAESLVETGQRIQDMPAVGGVLCPDTARKNFEKQQGGTMLAMTMVLTVFASVIAVGIVYNNARVSLSTRSRDLASMRVLGFTRTEIFSVLIGELSVQVLLAIPIGLWLGIVATDALLSMDPENFRMPASVSGKTYLFSAGITIAASLASGFMVRRKLDRLDLIGSLKTRE